MSPLLDWIAKRRIDRQWKKARRDVRAASEERQRLLQGKEDVVAAVSALLFEFDPIGVNFEENTDEYDPEAQTIVIGVSADSSQLSIGELTDLVHDEFINWFGSDVAGPRDSYVELTIELRNRGLV